MITLEPITSQNAMLFKEVRLRALQDTPSAFGSTYAKEVQLTDDQWVERAAQRTNERSAGCLAMEAGGPCGIVSLFLDEEDATLAHLVSMWVAPTHRRLGIGRTLIETMLAWAAEHHAD